MADNSVIFCEGKADGQFLKHFFAQRELANFVVKFPDDKDSPGTTGFKSKLDGFKVATEREHTAAIILMRDNNGDAAASFKQVVAQIKASGDYPVPALPREVVKKSGWPDVSVLMLPWDDEPGTLETLCYTSAAGKRPTIARCVEEYVKCVDAEGWDIGKLSKLKMRCLLSAACQKDPNTSLVYAWSGNGRPTDLIPLDHSCFDRIAKFFRGFS